MTKRYLTAILFLLAQSEAFGAELPEFSLPLDCENGPTCFLQNMMDMDPGPARRDPFCGKATYDGHKGTDIRVRNLPEMRKNIPILSIANGKVLRTRNNIADHLAKTQKDFNAVKGIECGNGVVIDHGKIGDARWISQTCHLAKDSVPVKPGQTIKRGEKIGTIGLSGSTQFPHVHISVRKNGKLVDLVTGQMLGQECVPAPTTSLLKNAAYSQLAKMRTPLLMNGFSSAAVTGTQLVTSNIKPPALGHPLIFYTHFINLMKGDRVKLTITDSSGRQFAESVTEPLQKHKATHTAYTGRKSGGKKGNTYIGQGRLLRNGKTIFTSEPITVKF